MVRLFLSGQAIQLTRLGGRYAPYAAPAASSSYRPAAAAPAAGPSRNGWSSQSTTTGYAARVPVLQDWKPNPMWKPIKALTNMEMLPGESSSTRPMANDK